MKIYVAEEMAGIAVDTQHGEIVSKLKSLEAPPTSRVGTEYVLVIIDDTVYIMLTNIGQIPELLTGSILSQIEKGSLEVGFVKLYDKYIDKSILEVVREHWRLVKAEADAQCGLLDI